MKLIGDEMLNSGEVKSTEFIDNTIKFNRLRVNDLSEVDLQTVPKNIVITTNDGKEIYLNDKTTDEWNSWDKDYSTLKRKTISDSVGSEFNYIHFLNNNSRYFGIDNSALSGLTAESSFVIDWWMFKYEANTLGTLMYNGSSPDLVDNKELCITTSGDIIDPITLDVVSHPENDGFLNIIYPPLKSDYKINDSLWHHFALVAKDGQIQLIVDSKVNDQTIFEGINSIEDLLFGFGYSSGIEAYVGKIRITKDDDLGWFDGGFDLPVNDYVADGNTAFLMDSTSLVDVTTNNVVAVTGDPLSIYQENHYLYIHPSDINSIIRFNFSEDTSVYLPYGKSKVTFELLNSGTGVLFIKSLHGQLDNFYHFYPFTVGTKISYINNNWLPHDPRYRPIIDNNTLESWKTPSVYISTYEGGVKNYGTDTRCNPSAQPLVLQLNPTIRAPRSAYEAGVMDMSNSGWTFSSDLPVNRGYFTTFKLSFYVLFLGQLSQNWAMVYDSGWDGLGIDYMGGTTLRWGGWHRYSATDNSDYTESWSNIGVNPLYNRWFYVEARWYTQLYSTYTDRILRWLEIKTYDGVTGGLISSQAKRQDNGLYPVAPTTYNMPNYFAQGPYLVSNVQLNIL